MAHGSERTYGIAPPEYRLPPTTRLGRVRLRVSSLSRAREYYEGILGFTARAHDAQTVRLHIANASDWLIELSEAPGTRPVDRGGLLGLYHFAILVPDREWLGRFVAHLGERGVRFGSADHLVSEAIYLWDPDGLGIEVYADRPRESWRVSERELVMTTDRLDLRGLVEASGGGAWTGMPPGTTMGHMHLSVGDLATGRRFYHGALGLDLVVWSYPGALFLSAGGYHHHLGMNTWAAGARPPGAQDARLLEWELCLPDGDARNAATDSLRAHGYPLSDDVVVDPWGTRLRLQA